MHSYLTLPMVALPLPPPMSTPAGDLSQSSQEKASAKTEVSAPPSAATVTQADNPPSRSLRVCLGDVDPQNIQTLRALNLALFPVRYTDAFYSDILRSHRAYAKFAYVDARVAGAICCRLEPIESSPAQRRTYIMTLGVVESYRRCQVGSALLQGIVEQSVRDGADHVYLHVQTNNEIALQFYRKFGFEVTETIRNYYKRIEPPDCHVLLKKL